MHQSMLYARIALGTLAVLLIVTTSPAAAQKRGGTLVQLTYPEPPSLAPYINTSLAVPQVSSKVYDGLVEYDFNLQPIPSLAESWTVAPDGKSITFKLRPGVKFHDGQPFTSADVQFSIMEVLKKVHPRGINFLKEVAAVETPEIYTAVIKLTEPAPYLMKALSAADSPMLPKHIFEKGDIRNHENANKPVGTGPFKFVEWRRGELIRLDRNPDYWRSGQPYLDRIVVRFIPDAATRTALMENGEAHVAGYGALPYSDAKRLSTNSGIEITTKGYEMFSMMNDLTFNTKRPPFDNVKVRQALSYAVDRQFVVDNVFFGFGKPATGQISSNFAASGLYNPNVRDYSQPNALETANKLLDEAGFPRGANGTRFEITLDTLASYGDYYQREAEVIQQNFAKIGVKVTIRSEGLATWLKRAFTDYDFDLTQNGLANLSDPVLGMHRAVHSRSIRQGSVFANGSRWSSPKTDQLMDAAAKELDTDRRKELYAELQKILAEEAPIIWVNEISFPSGINKKFKDVISTPQGLHGSFHKAWLDR